MSVQRKVKLFRNGRNQAVRIPREFELPGQDAVIHREGGRLVIESAAPGGPNARLATILATLRPLETEDDFPIIHDSPPGSVDL